MYKYFDNKEILKRAQTLCSEIMKEVENEVRDRSINCQFFLIGSGARNMVTYLERRDKEKHIDFDYNLNIFSCPENYTKEDIKEHVRKAFNVVWNRRGFKGGIHDSTSSLSTDAIFYDDDPKTFFSIDLGIVTLDKNGKWYRLIHKKTGIIGYSWEQVRNSESVNDKARVLKKNKHWDGKDSVRERYLQIKNKYLSNNNDDHPSFVCYIEAVHQIYQKWGNK